jgi:hypothetical protein
MINLTEEAIKIVRRDLTIAQMDKAIAKMVKKWRKGGTKIRKVKRI